jgi:hypothetical protein
LSSWSQGAPSINGEKIRQKKKNKEKKSMACGSRKPRTMMAIHPENNVFLELRTPS